MQTPRGNPLAIRIEKRQKNRQRSHRYMATAWLRHHNAAPASSAFITGAEISAATRSKYVAASLSSAAERGPASQASPLRPLSTTARILLVWKSFGANVTTLVDSALSPSTLLVVPPVWL